MSRHLLTARSIQTADGPPGDAVLIDGSRIVATGRWGDLDGDHPVHDHADATIVPGLWDAHMHPIGYTAALQRPSLKDAPDFAALADIVADGLRGQPGGTALTGLRLDDESLEEQRLPDRTLLDAVSSDRPIILMRYCGHVAVANSAALRLAGIDRDTPDPPGGVIDRGPDGVPTGVLRETAFEPVTAAIRPLAPPLTPDHVVDALTALASIGLTGIGAMAATDSGLWGGTSDELELLLQAADRSPIPLRVFVMAKTPEALEAAAERVAAAGPQASFAGVKMFSDGSLGGHTAAMYEPFADAPGVSGTDRLDPDWAEVMARTALGMGTRVAIHAIGDRANAAVLDLMERLIAAGADPGMLRIEHASVLTAADIQRMARLGVTASVQPAFIASETAWLEKRLGPDRLRRTYAFGSLERAGAPLAGGSDCPVEPPHPLLGMAAARDRLGVIPEEGLDPAGALGLFTAGAAAACGVVRDIGAGDPASFTVLDTDPLQATADDLRSARVLATWVNGEPVSIPAHLTAWQS